MVWFHWLLICIVVGSSSLNIPLTCKDLTYDNIFELSHAGAQHFLVTSPAEYGLGPLRYRQYSDRNPHGPLFEQVAQLTVSKGSSTNGTYTWRPDYATWLGSLSDNVQIYQQVGYPAQDVILGIAKVTNQGATPATLQLSGVVSPKQTKVAIQPTSGPSEKGVKVDLRATTDNDWGDPPSTIHLQVSVTVNITGATVKVNGGGYLITFDAPPKRALYFAVQFRLITLPATTALQSPLTAYAESPFDTTTRSVNSWLAAVEEPPKTFSDHLLKVYYNAWFQFWYNLEHEGGNWTENIITPSKERYGRGIWLWDTGFHTMALVHGGRTGVNIAKNQIKVLVHGENVVGHLPREIFEGAVGNDMQAPGILTWASLVVYNKTKDLSFIEFVYPEFSQNNDWFYANTDPQHDGLCEWEGESSGWDTSPRWDEGIVEAIDLNCWLYLDQLYLAEMAKLLNKGSDAAKWLQKANRTAALIQENLYSKEDGVFFDRLPNTKKFVKVITPATFWTMLVGIATPAQAQSMMKIYYNSSQLGTEYPMPCVSRSSPKFNPNNYWRGPTWINVNWLSLLGWERYGLQHDADTLRNKSINLIGNHPTPREYYNPLTGGGLGAYDYMWTGALLIVMVRERMEMTQRSVPMDQTGQGHLLHNPILW